MHLEKPRPLKKSGDTQICDSEPFLIDTLVTLSKALGVLLEYS